MSLQLPAVHTSSHPLSLLGLVHLEFMNDQTHVMGRQTTPLLLLPNAAAAEEACLLLAPSSIPSLSAGGGAGVPASAREPGVPTSSPQRPPRDAPVQGAEGSSSSAVSPFLLDLACWLDAATSISSGTAAEGRQLLLSSQLLSHCLDSVLPGCATGVMDVLVAARSVDPDRLLHTFIAAEVVPPAPATAPEQASSVDRSVEIISNLMTPLHLAVRRGSLPVIHSMLAWSELQSVRPDWTVAGPSGICPLHLAALLPNAEAVVQGMLELPRPYGPDIAAAWLLCRSSDGRTPAELGSSVGLSVFLDSLAYNVLARAADEEDASYATGTDLGSVAKSVSSASGASGIAAMMESLLTGEDGVRASCEATGPSAMVWLAPSRVVAVAEGFSVCGTPVAI